MSKSADETETGTVIQCLIVTPSSRLSVVSHGCCQRPVFMTAAAFEAVFCPTCRNEILKLNFNLTRHPQLT
jgi:hypothetical protein